MLNHILRTALAGVLAALLLPGDLALADGDPATDDVLKLVPYQGRLEKDGVGLTTTLDITFRLFDGDAGPEVWLETQSVPVYGGRFAVMLGICFLDGTDPRCPLGDQALKGIDEVLRAADDLLLGVEIQTGDGPVVLAQRKRLLPVPYSVLSAAAADLSVGGALTVAGTASVGGELSAGTYMPRYQAWADPGRLGDGRAAICNDNSSYNALMIVGNDSDGGAGGDRNVELYDNLHVGKNISWGGNLTSLSVGNHQHTCVQNSNTVTENVAPSANHFCAIHQVHSSTTSAHECVLNNNGTNWTLSAIRWGSGYTCCTARCLSW